jgi:UDPglucose 6-dehydrogenase
VAALIRTAREAEAELTLVEQLQTVNEERKIAMAKRIEGLLGGSVEGKTIALLGVTFKPDTDDMRGAPSLIIAPILQQKGATVRAYDPQGRRQAEPMLPGLVWCQDPMDAVKGADATVVLTEWNVFRGMDLTAIKAAMSGDVLADYRNIFTRANAKAAGFVYDCVGRPG